MSRAPFEQKFLPPDKRDHRSEDEVSCRSGTR